MKPTKSANRIKFLGKFIASLAFLPALGWSQVLDLNQIAKFNFTGIDAYHDKKPCELEAQPIQADFLHRSYQDYKMLTQNAPGFDFDLTLHGGNILRTPTSVDAHYYYYELAFERFQLRLNSLRTSPLDIDSFTLWQRGSGTGTLIPMIKCEQVKKTPRY